MNYIEEIAKLRLDIETPEDKTMIIKVKKEKKEKKEDDRRGSYIRTPEMREQLSRSLKKAWSRPEVRQRHLNYLHSSMWTSEVRQRLSAAHKGIFWWTDGVIETKARECPEGMRRGRVKREYTKGKLWWTNGEKTTTSKECPGDGWRRGRK